MASSDLGRANPGGAQPTPDGHATAGASRESWRPVAASGDPGARTGPIAPTDVPLDQPFDSNDLFALRAAVAAHASDLGLSPDQVADVVMIAHELASNVVRHGGTTGRLRLWRANNSVLCQVSDTGPGLPEPASVGIERAPLSALDGRGLWIVRQLSDRLDIDSGPQGATLTATIAIEHTKG